MAKLVFDIETSALPLEQFDEAQQEYLFREREKIADEAARKRAARGAAAAIQSLAVDRASGLHRDVECRHLSRPGALHGEDYDEEAEEAGPVEFGGVRG